MRLSTLTCCLALAAADARGQTIAAGRSQFQTRCVSCHGEDGAGGARGVTIVGLRMPRATSKDAVRDLIRKGIPDAGMPAFSISDEDLDPLSVYVMSLVTPATNRVETPENAPGDAAAGERFYTEKGHCTGCHMVRGRGGVLGPDLSNVGRTRTAAQIEQALRDPGDAAATSPGGRRGAAAYRAVTVRLRDGRTIRGLAKNESAFDLQVLSVDGTLHLLLKDQVAGVVREQSLMPKVEGTATEIRDLVSYLSRLTTDPNTYATRVAPMEMGAGLAFADVARPKPGAWPTYHGNTSGNRFSALDQINTSTVQRLAPKWMFTIQGAPRALQVTPVVVDGVMYVTSVNEAYGLYA